MARDYTPAVAGHRDLRPAGRTPGTAPRHPCGDAGGPCPARGPRPYFLLALPCLSLVFLLDLALFFLALGSVLVNRAGGPVTWACDTPVMSTVSCEPGAGSGSDVVDFLTIRVTLRPTLVRMSTCWPSA